MNEALKKQPGQTGPAAVIKLNYPVEYNGELVTELIAPKRLKAKFLRDLSTNNMTFGDNLVLVRRLFCVTDKLIDELDGSDAMQAVKVVTDFLGNGQETGDKE